MSLVLPRDHHEGGTWGSSLPYGNMATWHLARCQRVELPAVWSGVELRVVIGDQESLGLDFRLSSEGAEGP